MTPTTAATAAAAYLSVYLGGATAFDATILPIVGNMPAELGHDRYASSRGTPVSGWYREKTEATGSAQSEHTPVLIGPELVEDAIVAQVREFAGLTEGWDGYRAAKPNSAAIHQAINFLRAAGELSSGLEPTLHADGSVILEPADEKGALLEFKGDGHVIFAFEGGRVGREHFDGFSLSPELRTALEPA